MKDLIKEINIYECEVERHSLGIIYVKDCYLKEDIDNILNQHNIITAPKQIKLSEIVSRLNKTSNDIFIFKLYFSENIFGDKAIGYDYFDDGINEIIFNDIISFNENMEIIRIELPNIDDFKWLYALWIAGTEIIDDMEKVEE